jgi:hypothetical protein
LAEDRPSQLTDDDTHDAIALHDKRGVENTQLNGGETEPVFIKEAFECL